MQPDSRILSITRVTKIITRHEKNLQLQSFKPSSTIELKSHETQPQSARPRTMSDASVTENEVRYVGSRQEKIGKKGKIALKGFTVSNKQINSNSVRKRSPPFQISSLYSSNLEPSIESCDFSDAGLITIAQVGLSGNCS